ncbi:MAG: sulfotransferase [Chroococcidiopsidaceae cyanobacterium CP_BM_ER_R8_30]|nr:sulfotransferase [Chroococcidiopsidaceae cyanobacterium CP_BM_ER_R8_30]
METILPVNLGYQIGLIGFTRFSNILRLSHYVIGIHPRYLLRLLLVVSLSLIGLPLGLWERIVCSRKIAQTQIENPPIFIVGHWRSGTTHLHNLMTQDSNFGYLSMYQSVVPDCSLVGRDWLKHLLAKILPIKRPMDNMIWPIEGPQEEEVALCKTMPTSFYTHFLFPSKTRYLFRKYVLMDGASPRAIAEFKRKYYRLLQVATIHAQGKPLILKNPVNTARMALLLELFPDAKFIHIHRSPYDVFRSAQNLHQTLTPITTLQTLNANQAEETILMLYEEMMQRYLKNRSLIPSGNLVEIRFEDLEQKPMAEIKRIYEVLNLPNYESVMPTLKAYLDGQKSYQKNQLPLSPEAIQKIEQRWQFAFSNFGYNLLV